MATYTGVQTPTSNTSAPFSPDTDVLSGSEEGSKQVADATPDSRPAILDGITAGVGEEGIGSLDYRPEQFNGSRTGTELAGTALVDYRPVSRVGTHVRTEQRSRGVIIPTGPFRSVSVYVEDSEGKPLTEAEWVQSAGLFPTAGRVEPTPDGRMAARLWLLDAAYQEFSVLADSGQEGVGLVWYQQDTGDGPALARDEREATLRFSRVEAGGDNGLSVGYGASIGGS